MVPKTHAVHYDGQRRTAAKLVSELPQGVWADASTGMGVQGERRHRWACLSLTEDCPPGMRRWLLVQRDLDDADKFAYYLAFGADSTTEAELLRVCGARWQVEECFAQAKGEVGLDQYEVRTWQAWHRFVTLCLLAHAYLVVLRLAGQQEEAVMERGALLPT
jgi:hypothetical protein